MNENNNNKYKINVTINIISVIKGIIYAVISVFSFCAYFNCDPYRFHPHDTTVLIFLFALLTTFTMFNLIWLVFGLDLKVSTKAKLKIFAVYSFALNMIAYFWYHKVNLQIGAILEIPFVERYSIRGLIVHSLVFAVSLLLFCAFTAIKSKNQKRQ